MDVNNKISRCKNVHKAHRRETSVQVSVCSFASQSAPHIGCITDENRCKCVHKRVQVCVSTQLICARALLSPMNKSALSLFTEMIAKCIFLSQTNH